jgi:hypothetical protein
MLAGARAAKAAGWAFPRTAARWGHRLQVRQLGGQMRGKDRQIDQITDDDDGGDRKRRGGRAGAGPAVRPGLRLAAT